MDKSSFQELPRGLSRYAAMALKSAVESNPLPYPHVLLSKDTIFIHTWTK